MTKQIGISRITGKPLTMPRKSKWRPSDELAPVNRPRNVDARRLDNHTETQALLGAVANRMLRKAKFFARKSKSSDPVDADSITVNGQLRPTWQGRA